MIAIGIPAYDRKLTIQTARSLLNERAAASIIGADFEVIFSPGTSLVTLARNQIVKRFLESGNKRLVFVDSDIAWEPGALLKLAGHPVDIVGGAYRFKKELEDYPVQWLASEAGGIWTDDKHGLVEVQTLPGGFLCISRDVLLRMKARLPDRTYMFGGDEFYAFFENPFINGQMRGEDSGFCLSMREQGERVWLDPELRLTHVDGAQEYTGRVSDWLMSGKWKK